MDSGANRRDFLKGLPAAGIATTIIAGGAAALVAPAARAEEDTKSTWDRIMSTKSLRVGAATAEPWYFKDATGSTAPGAVTSNGLTWRGLGPMLSKEMADAMGVELQIVETTWANAVAGLQANQFDVMLVLDATPKRALAIDFLPVPTAWVSFALLARPDLEAKTWKELDDPKFKVSVALGSSTDQFLTATIPNATFVRVQEMSETIAAFQAGQVDAMGTSGPTADIIRSRINIGKVILPKPIVAYPTGTGLRYEPTNQLKDYLTTTMTYFYYSGKIEAIFEQYVAYRGLDPKTATPLIRELW